MHLSPLTGIETVHSNKKWGFNLDASFTPYGDWNHLRGRWHESKFLMHLSPLTGIETICAFIVVLLVSDASFTPYGDWNDWSVAVEVRLFWMHLSPLTGIETVVLHTDIVVVLRCISHPLRGLKHCDSVVCAFCCNDASLAPYGDWNTFSPSSTADCVMNASSPLRGLKISLFLCAF